MQSCSVYNSQSQDQCYLLSSMSQVPYHLQVGMGPQNSPLPKFHIHNWYKVWLNIHISKIQLLGFPILPRSVYTAWSLACLTLVASCTVTLIHVGLNVNDWYEQASWHQCLHHISGDLVNYELISHCEAGQTSLSIILGNYTLCQSCKLL